MKRFVSRDAGFEIALVCIALTIGQSHAATYYVNAARPDDTGTGTSWATAKKTIQSAVDLAATGSTVLVTNGVYNIGTTVIPGFTLSNRVVITKAIAVRSVNGPQSTFIDGSGTNFYNTTQAVRCVFMTNGVLDGFTLREGSTRAVTGSSGAGGGVYMYNAIPGTTATNCIFENCKAFYGGGSFYGTLNNCLLTGNIASSDGGGSYNGTLNNCLLSGNTADNGGGSYTGTLNNCILSTNKAKSDGGGSYNGTLTNCTLSANTAYQGGGSCNGTLTNCTLSANTAYRGGGSYYGTLNSCTLSNNTASSTGGGSNYGTLNNCTMFRNSAPFGGGSHRSTLNSCTLVRNWATKEGGGSSYGTLNNCTLSNNVAENNGGGSLGGTLNNCTLSANSAFSGGGSYYGTLNSCVLTGNRANWDGGGSYNGTLNNCLLSGNTADDGGGSYNGTLNNCILSGNTAGAGGGSVLGTLNYCKMSGNTAAIGGGSYVSTLNSCVLTGNFACQGGGSLGGTLNNCTLSGNSASTGNGSGGTDEGTVNNCIVWGNTGSDGTIVNYTSGTTFQSSCTTPLPSGSGNIDSDPLLVNAEDFRLRVGSPCLNTGSNAYCTTEVDFRGHPRIQEGRVDIGAFEGEVPVVSPPIIAPDSNTVFTNSLTLVLDNSMPGAIIRYTLDGSEPTINSLVYEEPFKLNRSTTVKVKAFKSGMAESATVTAHYILQQVSTPVFYPISGYSAINNIDITFTFEEGSTVRYTLDNSEPNLASVLYTNVLSITQNTTIKAKAFQTGMTDSATATATYSVCVATPVFDPPSGTVATNAVAVSLSCPTAGATIRYTTNGADPTSASARYTNSLVISQSMQIKAKAFQTGMTDSATATATYSVCVATPVFDPPSGTVATNAVAVSLSCPTAGATIRYTTNGADPTSASARYYGPLAITQSTTIKAKAFQTGMIDSDTITAGYTVIQTVAKPTFVPLSGTVGTNTLVVTLYCATAGATIRYTLDNSEPTVDSSVYSGAFTINQTGTVKGRAYKAGMVDSATATAAYTLFQTIEPPIFSPETGTVFSDSLAITLSCVTIDAVIRYTLDNTDPTDSSTLYSKPIKISKSTNVRARTYKLGIPENPLGVAIYFKGPTLAEAVDVTNMMFTTGGSALWKGQMLASAHDGVDAAQSGSILDSQTSWMETAITGAGSITFWWKASCEDDPDADNWDYMRVLVDGIELSRLDGITDWREVALTLGDGAHVIRWEYSKDESLSDGEDKAWVDQISFALRSHPETTTTPVPVPFGWLDQYPVLLGLAGGDYEAAAWADVDRDGHAAWQEYVTGSIPTNRESVLKTLIGMSNGLPYVTWSPDLGIARVYMVLGRTNLIEGVWYPTNSGSRFFRTRVDMP